MNSAKFFADLILISSDYYVYVYVCWGDENGFEYVQGIWEFRYNWIRTFINVSLMESVRGCETPGVGIIVKVGIFLAAMEFLICVRRRRRRGVKCDIQH